MPSLMTEPSSTERTHIVWFRIEYLHPEEGWTPYARSTSAEALSAAVGELRSATPDIEYRIMRIETTEEVFNQWASLRDNGY